MGNQPSTVSGSNVARAARHNPYISDWPPCNSNIQPPPQVDIGISNAINLRPDVYDDRNNTLHNIDASKENSVSYNMDSKSEGYLRQMSTNTIFYPRIHHENSAEFSRSAEPNIPTKPQVVQASLPHQHQKSHKMNHRIVKVQNKQISKRNNLLYPSTVNESTVGRSSSAIANIIGVTSKSMYAKKIILGSDKDVDTLDGEDIQEAARPDLSAQLSFDVDPGTLGPASKPSQDETETTQPRGWSIKGEIPLKNIRNFSIIAHIDHGKSTLADRLLEMTGALQAKAENKQVLDKLQVEKERGITVKAQTASLFYKYKNEEYLLNLIDTPGHVDFSNEVTRSLAACQGVILLVDANQGVQAQTVANFYLAFAKELTVVPVLNKIDLRNADPAMCKDQLLNLFSIDPDDVLSISAKTGLGVDTLLETIIQKVPPPPSDRAAPMRALIFDSWYDKYRGAVTLIYVRDGVMKVGDEITSAHSKQRFNVKGMGLLRPHEVATEELVGGQVGWMVCNMRSVAEAHIGDTLHHSGKTSVEPLVGFTPARPMVFAGVYPMEQAEYNDMRNAIEKLALNDPGVTLTPESSLVLGQGWRVGFLGLLHLEVFNQRLEQEYGAEAVMTAPSVPYKVKLKTARAIAEYRGKEVIVSDPSKLPPREDIDEILEPMVLGTVITPMEYAHKIIPECIERRGLQKASTTIDSNRQMLQFILPLNEIIVDFHDTIKAQTSGFASFDYEDHGYKAADLIKLDIKVNGKTVDALSSIIHESKAEYMGRRLCEKLAKIIPRQMVEVAIQAAVGGRILARETIKAFRKDVTAKLYGGDRTRKMKLLKKQAEGKKRMKTIASVNIPREAFIDYMKR